MAGGVDPSALTNPFADAVPTRYLYVSAGAVDTGEGPRGSMDNPFGTIQRAIDKATPGTAIIVLPGTYNENVQFSQIEGTPENPIWLTSAYGPETVTIEAVDNARSTIAAYGEDNIIVSGFTVKGGLNGIQFSQSGTNFTNFTKNIVIENNIIMPTVKDGIKISQGENIFVSNNVIVGSGDQGIDFVYVTNGVIANNDVSEVVGNSGIFAKGGSENILIRDNYIHDVSFSGISVGGWSSLKSGRRPDNWDYEVKNILVTGNKIEHAGKFGIDVLGAHDAVIVDNFVAIDDPNRPPVHVSSGGPDLNPPPISSNVSIYDNVFDRSYAQMISITSGSTDIIFRDNSTDGEWSDADCGANPGEAEVPSDIPRWFESGETKNVKIGTDYADTLKGTKANDRLDGGKGADSMEGGGNDDIYVVDHAGDKVVERIGSGVDTVEVWIASYALGTHVENLTVKYDTGGVYRGNSLDNMIKGAAGADDIDGDSGADWLDGGAGDDILKGGDGGDRIYGGLGARDVIDGGKGNDEIFDEDGVSVASGGEGDDTIVVRYVAAPDPRGTMLVGAAGSDLIEVISENARLVLDIRGDGIGREEADDGNDAVVINGAYATAKVKLMGGDDVFVGGNGVDIVDGGSGGDQIAGEAGKDVLAGNDGNDTLYGGAGADSLNGCAGDDVLLGGDGDDHLNGGTDRDFLDGGSGHDELVGGDGNDTVVGGDGNDYLYGNKGNDLIIGGAGRDFMKGGAGRDTFVIACGEGEGDDIGDFVAGQDILQLVGYGPDASLSYDGSAWIITGAGFTETFQISGVTELGLHDYFFL